MDDDFEALLSVPIEIIFREIMQTQIIPSLHYGTFLFSKSEVTALLRVAMLASELTTTMAMVYEALDRVRKGNMYLNEIIMEATNSNHNYGYLRALLPIIAVHSETAKDALTNVTSDTNFSISRILQELDDCAIELSKFSETNFNMADQLDWTMAASGQCSVLSREKRAIAEIEEAVVARIIRLKEMAIGGTNEENVETTTTNDVIDTTSTNDDDEHDRFIPMRDLCHKIFKQKEKTEFNLNTSSSEHSQSQITAAEAMTSLSKEG
ncbi:hypothetical protein ACHAWT_007345 [Skeletonema menzelii]